MELNDVLSKPLREIGEYLGVSQTTVAKYKTANELEIKIEAKILQEKMGLSVDEFKKMERNQPERLQGMIEALGLSVPKNLLLGVSDTHLKKIEKEDPELVARMVIAKKEGLKTVDREEGKRRQKKLWALLKSKGHECRDAPDSYVFVPTGIKKLDEKLGGGLARGHMMNIVGKSGAGKTTLAIMMGVAFQEIGEVLYMDIERSWDASYAQRLGADLSLWDIKHPKDSQEALDHMRYAAELGSHKLIILDSIAQIPFKTELENETGKRNMERAIVMNSHVRIVLSYLLANDVTAIYVNQLRENFQMFGEKYIQPGGEGILYSTTQGIYLQDKGKGTNKELHSKGERPVMFYFPKCRQNSNTTFTTEEFMITKEDGFKKD